MWLLFAIWIFFRSLDAGKIKQSKEEQEILRKVPVFRANTSEKSVAIKVYIREFFDSLSISFVADNGNYYFLNLIHGTGVLVDVIKCFRKLIITTALVTVISEMSIQYMYTQGYICLSEGVHFRLAIEDRNIFTSCLFPNIYTCIS